MIYKTKPPHGSAPAAARNVDRFGGLIKSTNTPLALAIQARRVAVRFRLPAPTARLVADLAYGRSA